MKSLGWVGEYFCDRKDSSSASYQLGVTAERRSSYRAGAFERKVHDLFRILVGDWRPRERGRSHGRSLVNRIRSARVCPNATSPLSEADLDFGQSSE